METAAETFHHPYRPYSIQLDLMKAIYDCIEDSKIGIFESPTGTGKSLSLICSSLTWLRRHDIGQASRDPDERGSDGPEWIRQHARAAKVQEARRRKVELAARLDRVRDKELRRTSRDPGQRVPKRRRIETPSSRSHVDPVSGGETSYELDDYISDEDGKSTGTASAAPSNGVSAQSYEMLEQLGMVVRARDDLGESETNTRIFYCSRTHAQLSQFADEVRRVQIPLWEDYDIEELPPVAEDSTLNSGIRHVPLASRKNLCINPKVLKLKSVTAINERCLELQQPKTAKDRKCPYLPQKGTEDLVEHFRDLALAEVRDIEEMSTIGQRIGICPYYASRAAVKHGEIITLPYSLLLQKTAREAMQISLKDQVIVVDEAHNLMDAIVDIHSVSISLSCLTQARHQLRGYLIRYRNKLKGKNRVYVTQVVRSIDSLMEYMERQMASADDDGHVVSVADLLTGKGVDQINMFKLRRYLQQSKLARKVDGQYLADLENGSLANGSPSTPVLQHVESFLQSLMHRSSEGQFTFSKDSGQDCTLRYLLLDPSEPFREVLQEARAVILLGGTMSPLEDYLQHLFPYVDSYRVSTLSCGHVIPDKNLLVWPISHGTDARIFDFTFEKRDSPELIDALGNVLEELVGNIPDGVVVFFPSYAYLEKVTSRWRQPHSQQENIWQALNRQRAIFEESKGLAGVDELLTAYASAIASGRGAMLLSVIGGKLSEGINFSDKLGRGVIVIGLPYPNAKSPEWKAKIEFIKSSEVKRGRTHAQAAATSRDFYENACMRAVNQSIGRAIRHQNDYATILLLDRRYSTKRIQDKLPGWIQKGLRREQSSFGQILSTISEFFSQKHAS